MRNTSSRLFTEMPEKFSRFFRRVQSFLKYREYQFGTLEFGTLEFGTAKVSDPFSDIFVLPERKI